MTASEAPPVQSSIAAHPEREVIRDPVVSCQSQVETSRESPLISDFSFPRAMVTYLLTSLGLEVPPVSLFCDWLLLQQLKAHST